MKESDCGGFGFVPIITDHDRPKYSWVIWRLGSF